MERCLLRLLSTQVIASLWFAAASRRILADADADASMQKTPILETALAA
jgi:hypothetical protein